MKIAFKTKIFPENANDILIADCNLGVFGYCNKKLNYCFTVSPTVSAPLNDGKDYVEFRLEAPKDAGYVI